MVLILCRFWFCAFWATSVLSKVHSHSFSSSKGFAHRISSAKCKAILLTKCWNRTKKKIGFTIFQVDEVNFQFGQIFGKCKLAVLWQRNENFLVLQNCNVKSSRAKRVKVFQVQSGTTRFEGSAVRQRNYFLSSWHRRSHSRVSAVHLHERTGRNKHLPTSKDLYEVFLGTVPSRWQGLIGLNTICPTHFHPSRNTGRVNRRR